MGWLGSISADCLSFVANAFFVNEDDFDVVTSVDVTLCNGVDDVLACVFRFFLIGWQNLYFKVMAYELVVENWGTELHTRALSSISQLVVRTDSIVAEDCSFTFLIEATKQIKRIVWHKSSAVKSAREEFSDAFSRRLTSVLHYISANTRDQVLVQCLHICHHACRGNDALGCQFSGL